MKMDIERNRISNQFPLVPVDCLAAIRPSLNIDLMTVQKSFHIAKKPTAVKYTNDELKNQVPKVIYL
jgi:hypothetical protein